MIDPMSVCELDDGRPSHQVPRFHTVAAARGARTPSRIRAAADLENELDGKKRDDPEGDGAGRDEDADEVPEARPDDRNVRLEGVGIDDGRDGVRGVVKAVHELEAERDEERDAENDIGKIVGEWTTGGR